MKLKIMIADDEPKIRKGITKLIQWDELDMQLVATAEDGEMARDMAKEYLPDIAIVDICMPFLSGLELTAALKEINPGISVIVISGHDEFRFAQQAIKLGVEEYLVKPIDQEELNQILRNVKEKIETQRQAQEDSRWLKEKIGQNRDVLVSAMLSSWNEEDEQDIDPDVNNQLHRLGIDVSLPVGFCLVRAVETGRNEDMHSDNSLFDIVQNAAKTVFEKFEPYYIFTDMQGNVVIFSSASTALVFENVKTSLTDAILQSAGIETTVFQSLCHNYDELPKIYGKSLIKGKSDEALSAIVAQAKRYIDLNYSNSAMTLQMAADYMNISAGYLSRLLKQELGLSFVDYLTQVRIKHSLVLLNSHDIKMYEIAELVGYKNQHYFSTAFKKVMDYPPMEYRKGGKENG